MIRAVLLTLGALVAQCGCSGASSPGSGVGGSGGEVAEGGGSAGARAGAAGGGAAGGGGAGAGGGGGGSSDSCSCLPYEVAWWREGGKTAVQHKYYAKPCNTLVHSESPPLQECESSLIQGCDDTLGVASITKLLEDPALPAILAAAPILYGTDPRPFDGQVIHFELDGKVIELGDQCSGGNGENCEIPNLVESLPFTLDLIAQRSCDVPKAP
jgi:hypothetical protein